MTVNNQNDVVFYSIEGSTIKKFLIIDLLIGSGLFYAIKIISASVLMGMAGSMIGAEGIKRFPKWGRGESK